MKKLLLLSALTAGCALTLQAQELKNGYLTWPESGQLHTYISAWNGGNGTIQVNGSAWEDDEFFRSHVRPRERFQNTATQVNPSRLPYSATSTTQTGLNTDKRLVYWVCVGDESRNNVKTGALQNAVFDQEVFNMWSYVDNYGCWNAPYGWTPGVWADVCHKNGVSTHGVAGIPYSSAGSWSTTLTQMAALSGETVGKFLYYHGQDGLGYNSEFNGANSAVNGLKTLHNSLADYMKDKDPLWEVMWYAGTNDNATINFDAGIGNFTGLFKGASMFMNYNWHNTGTMTGDIQTAKGMSKSPMYIYAGMDMQGGQPRSGINYALLKDYQYSIGLWAGHSNNILWKNRQANGSSPRTKINTYIRDNEMWFGNGKLNPAIKQEITNNQTHRPSTQFAGMSSMMNARSTIKMTIANEPFYSYFNVGNGQYFNWKGERMNDVEWYSIGIQDYMPTWRYWFSPKWLGTEWVDNTDDRYVAIDGNTGMKAGITYEDAYMGGSCLKIEGSTTKEYLHLFKTNIIPRTSGQVMTVRYKLLAGEGDVNLVVGSVNNPSTKKQNLITLSTVANSESIVDQSFDKGWVTQTLQLKGSHVSSTNMPGGIGVIGLEFANAKNMELLIGEISIMTAANTTTPVSPTIKVARLLDYSSKGVDGKLIWSMPAPSGKNAASDPVYNDEVNASVYKLYAQQEDREPKMMAVTTGWAGFVFQMPASPEGVQRMRLGVSAVSADQKTESEITWSSYMDLPDYKVSTSITVDKTIIKPNEEFTMSFTDPLMVSATWAIKDESGSVLYSGTGTSVTCGGIANVGAYNLEVTYTLNGSTQTVTYPRYISVSSEAVGAMPQIYTMSVDGVDVNEGSADVEIGVNEAEKTRTFGYTGRKADGNGSRGLSLNEKWFGVQVGELGIETTQSFSVAAWVRLDKIPAESNFFTVEDAVSGGWPYNRWGYFWGRVNQEGKFLRNGMDGGFASRLGSGTEGNRVWYTYKDAQITPGVWTHVVFVFETTGNQFRMKLYINGKKQTVSQYLYANKGTIEATMGGETGVWSDLSKARNLGTYGECTGTEDAPTFTRNGFSLTPSQWIAFGGWAPDLSAVEGVIDDMQVWGKAMTDEDVKTSLEGFSGDNVPDDVLGFWDFESSISGSSYTGVAGKNATNKAPVARYYEYVAGDKNQGTSDRLESLNMIGTGGSPFCAGQASPVITRPTWTTRGRQLSASGTGEAGEAKISFPRQTDYSVDLTLENSHGAVTKSYPTVKVVPNPTAINGIEADGENDVKTYTSDGTIFLDFANDGDYNVEVYNMAGMLAARKQIQVVANQTATVRIGTAGVYLVKVSDASGVLRTVKLIVK